MGESSTPDRREEIREAATQYAFNRWRSLRFLGLLLLGTLLSAAGSGIDALARAHGMTWLRLVASAAWISSTACFVMFVLSLSRLARATRDETSASAERSASSGVTWWYRIPMFLLVWIVVFSLMWLVVPSSSRSRPAIIGMLLTSFIISLFTSWMILAIREFFQTDLHEHYALRVQREAGVVVREPPFRRPKLWDWIGVFGTMAFMMYSMFAWPVRIQPLGIGIGLLLFGLIKHAQDKRAFGLVHFLAFAPYWIYAVACAVGLRQPFADSSLSALRIGVPLFLLAGLLVVIAELCSRRQLRRLRRLLANAGEHGRHARD